MKCRIGIVVLTLCMLLSCARHHVSTQRTPETYSFAGVPFRPGAVSWSPDSGRLALIKDDQLMLFDAATGTARRIPDIKPLFLDWAPGERVSVLSETGTGREIIMLDAGQGTYYSIPAGNSTEAVRWLHYPDELITIAADVKRLTIGTFVTYRLSRVLGKQSDEFFQRELFFPKYRQDSDFTSGWAFPGTRPVHETVLIPEYHSPPVVSPYTYFSTVDPVTGLEEKVMKMEGRRFTILVSWSPDGSRIAASNDDGLLIIKDAGAGDPEGFRMPLNYEIRGATPSWNPQGSQIYFGGWLIRSDGQALQELLPGAADSIGIWSPDGEKLAVLTGTGTVIFDSLHPAFHPPDRPLDSALVDARDRLRLLRELLRDGLILNPEFEVRRAKIFNRIGGGGK